MKDLIAQAIAYLKSMLSEGSDVSAMRIMAMIALLTGVGIAFDGMHSGKDLSQTAVLASVFVGAAFAGKVTQKAFEQKKDQ